MWSDAEIQEIDSSFGQYLCDRSRDKPEASTLLHILDVPHTTKKQQFILLSSISNYHWYGLPSLKSSFKVLTDHLAYSQHVLHDPGTECNDDGFYLRKYPPMSPRNRIMYLLTNGEEGLYLTLKKCCELPAEENIDTENTQIPNEEPSKKKRKQCSRTMSVTARAVFESVGCNLTSQLNSANQNRTLYTKFKEQLITDGLIKWRYHDEVKDVCVMTDYSSTTGLLLPQSFVHVTATKIHNNETVLKCTCDIFNIIKRAGHQETPLWPEDDEVVPDASLTCLHCRFYRDHLMGLYEKLQNTQTDLNIIESTVKTSLHEMNNEVVLLGNVIPQGSTKFSVKGKQCYSLINITFPPNNCHAKCTNGMCCANLKNKKKIPKHLPIQNVDYICEHLNIFTKHLDFVKSLFPAFFTDNEGQTLQDSEISVQEREDLNFLDADQIPQLNGHFNSNTGLWEYKALSGHKPKEMLDISLIKSTEKRNGYVKFENLNEDTGLYGVYKLIPQYPEGNCTCGSQFDPDCEGKLKFTSTLYTRMGPVHLEAYDLVCNAGNCTIPYSNAAENENIFFLSKYTCAGDEIGWDFINGVMKMKTSFTAFCNELTRKYQTNNILSSPFMNPKTFITWVFAWLSAFKIDFRESIDPWCKHCPEILAGDGTHIGVSVKNMDLRHPVNKPDSDEVYKCMHRRYDRVLIRNKNHRQHLNYLCRKYLKKLKSQDIIDVETEATKTHLLLAHIQTTTSLEVTQFFIAFVQRTEDRHVLHCMARLLYMMSGDAALSSVLPFECHEIIQRCCEDIKNGVPVDLLLEEMKTYCVEVSQLLKLGIIHDFSNIVTSFVMYVLDHIKAVHLNNRPTPPSQPVPQSYNPSKGCAYYFTPSGNQLRQMPTYSVNCTSKNPSYDDDPEVDRACSKKFPSVSFGGFGYMFLWFCPIHGHSYGFHLISGGEGRKDPFSSLFKYMEKAPKHIFYDFACQLSEYCLNREPEFFKNTRFWHDLFHSLGHTCGINFKSGRVCGLEGINSEICEQVNSFLQCIKYTGSHLSQEHFMFFVQFFLHLMNTEKTKAFQRKATIAVAGQM